MFSKSSAAELLIPCGELLKCQIETVLYRGSIYIFREGFKTFPTYKHFLVPLQETTFENIVVKGEIAHDEQFFLLPTMFSSFVNNNSFIQRGL